MCRLEKSCVPPADLEGDGNLATDFVPQGDNAQLTFMRRLTTKGLW